MSTKKKKSYRGSNIREFKIYDDKLSQELSEVIDDLTHTGKKELDPEEFLKMRNICKRSDKYVIEAYDMIMDHLVEDHAQVRLSAFQLLEECFRRSHGFREKVAFSMDKILDLTTSVSLPPPTTVARELKRVVLGTIHQWVEAYGKKYMPIYMKYRYMVKVNKIDFDALDIADAATQARERENQRRKETINRQRVKKVLEEIQEKKEAIELAMTSLSNCINLVLPHPDDFFIASDCSDEETQPVSSATKPCDTAALASDSDLEEDGCDVGLREVGMANTSHSIQLYFTPSSGAIIEETPENAAIIENLHENAKVVGNKYLPSVKAWLEILSKSPGNEEEIKSLTELKGELEDVMFKHDRLTFVSADDVSSDSELEEVPEPPQPKSDMTKSADPTLWAIQSQEAVERVERDPTSLQTRPESVTKEPLTEPQPSTSKQSEPDDGPTDRKRKLLAVAPKLPYDVDLYHWEDEKLPVPTLISSNSVGHSFWVGGDSCMDELPLPEGTASLRTRVIEFSGQFTPVAHSCKVRLPSGKLCPRRDRLKCPFHGEIVPRDDTGNCINPKDTIRMQALAEKRQQEKPDWQNPKLLAEIKKSTGMDLKMPEKGKRKKKIKHPGLVDLKQLDNTTTKRLEKKLFNKSVVRRVASAMDRMDQRKFQDKFSDQFNYT